MTTGNLVKKTGIPTADMATFKKSVPYGEREK